VLRGRESLEFFGGDPEGDSSGSSDASSPDW